MKQKIKLVSMSIICCICFNIFAMNQEENQIKINSERQLIKGLKRDISDIRQWLIEDVFKAPEKPNGVFKDFIDGFFLNSNQSVAEYFKKKATAWLSELQKVDQFLTSQEKDLEKKIQNKIKERFKKLKELDKGRMKNISEEEQYEDLCRLITRSFYYKSDLELHYKLGKLIASISSMGETDSQVDLGEILKCIEEVKDQLTMIMEGIASHGFIVKVGQDFRNNKGLKKIIFDGNKKTKQGLVSYQLFF